MKRFLFLLIPALLLVSCGRQTQTTPMPVETNNTEVPAPTDTTTPTPSETTTTPPVTETKTYTSAEVSTHNNATSCWLILDNKIYDVTKFIPSHPGGKAILKGCGKDATEMFAGHPERAKDMKDEFYIGDFKG